MNKQQLKELIQEITKEEIKKIISPLFKKTIIPLIKETISKNLEITVKNQVNEILNEKLLKIMSNQQVLVEKKSPTQKKKYSLGNTNVPFEDEIDLEIETQNKKKQLREQLKKKLIDDNPLMETIYSDIGEEQSSNQSISSLATGYQNEDGIYVDSDDDGVDLDFLNEKLS